MKFIELRLKLIRAAEGQSWKHLVESPFIPPDEVLAWHGDDEDDEEEDGIEENICSDDDQISDDVLYYDDPCEAIRHTDEICIDIKNGPITSEERLKLYRSKGIIAQEYPEISTNILNADDNKDLKKWDKFVTESLTEDKGYYKAKSHMKKTIPRIYRCPYLNCNKVLASIRGLKSHLQFHYKKSLSSKATHSG